MPRTSHYREGKSIEIGDVDVLKLTRRRLKLGRNEAGTAAVISKWDRVSLGKTTAIFDASVSVCRDRIKFKGYYRLTVEAEMAYGRTSTR